MCDDTVHTPADVLEWTWFLNSFSKGFVYDFMYGDKDTYGVAFGLAGKAHMYQHINTPPGERVSALQAPTQPDVHTPDAALKLLVRYLPCLFVEEG